GEVTLPVKEEVIVETDEHGVPHIKAKNMQDLYTAQGYIQAQHRLFQMELSRRQADRKSTRLNSSHVSTSYAVFCLKKKKRGQDKRSNSKNKLIKKNAENQIIDSRISS